MNSDKFVYYDADFLAKFKKLAEVMEEKDKAVLHRYLIDNFSHIFKVFQYYARRSGWSDETRTDASSVLPPVSDDTAF